MKPRKRERERERETLSNINLATSTFTTTCRINEEKPNSGSGRDSAENSPENKTEAAIRAAEPLPGLFTVDGSRERRRDVEGVVSQVLDRYGSLVAHFRVFFGKISLFF